MIEFNKKNRYFLYSLIKAFFSDRNHRVHNQICLTNDEFLKSHISIFILPLLEFNYSVIHLKNLVIMIANSNTVLRNILKYCVLI